MSPKKFLPPPGSSNQNVQKVSRRGRVTYVQGRKSLSVDRLWRENLEANPVAGSKGRFYELAFVGLRRILFCPVKLAHIITFGRSGKRFVYHSGNLPRAWTEGHAMHGKCLGLDDDPPRRLVYRIRRGPTLGVFTQRVKNTELSGWRYRHIDRLANPILDSAALLLGATPSQWQASPSPTLSPGGANRGRRATWASPRPSTPIYLRATNKREMRRCQPCFK